MHSKVEIDDRVIESERDREAVTTPAERDEALRVEDQIRRQAGLRAVRGKVKWEGDLAALRTDLPED